MRKCLVIFMFFLIMGCAPQSPVKIGYLGGLTGSIADLGISGRNGASVAVLDVNASGGINGHPVELVIRDDKQNTERCIEAAKELIDQKVIAVVGPMTSDMSIAALPLFEKARVPIVSPTASTPLLTGLDDYFLRVNPPDDSEASTLAAYVSKLQDVKKIIALFTEGNLSFTQGLYMKFVSELNKLGSWDISKKFYSSEGPIDYGGIINSVMTQKPDVLFFIATSLDTAQFCQQIKKQGFSPFLIGTGWAMTDDLIAHGGRSVDGIVFSHYHNNQSELPKYLAFRKKYYEVFKSEPDFIAALGYNALMVIAESARQKGMENMKRAILELGSFQGLQGPLTLDKYGDAELSRHYISIKDGQFIDL
ncbi:MAG: ABC transporter substrate-binding protein [Spirochaetales bacterium]|nr:ABC transporter substrate-binding protein [Spirochaetales bacterium]